jgi:endonuclease/exonuclease/phosphatase family metal-dependent hydrolase
MSLPSVRALLTRGRPLAPAALIAAVFLLTVELLRATNPLLDRAAAEVGVIGAARLAVVIFLAPALIGIAVRLAGATRTLLGAVALLVLLRLVAQAQDPATLLVVGAGAAVGVAALVLAVTRADSGVAAAVGVLAGTVADLAVRVGFGSWDMIFRPGVLPWLLVLLASGVAAAAALGSGPDPAGSGTVPTGPTAALGPYLALYVMAYGSGPIVAAHAGVSLPLATGLLIVTAAAGIELVRRTRLPGGTGAIPEPDRWFAGLLALLALAGAVAAAYWLTGPVVLLAIAVAALAAAVLLVRALTPRPGRVASRPAVTAAVAAGLAGLGYLLPVMVYQVHYDLEFPFDNRYALLAAAVLLGAAGLGVRPGEREADRSGLLARPAAVSVAAALAVLVPLAVAVTGPAVPAPQQSGATVRLMSWNVMYGRHHTDGTLDPAAVAEAVAAVDPDVLLLQEVSRGWPIGGGTDLLEYLSRRLAMPYHWAPAADGQFGNALLTRLPVSGVHTERFPFVQGPMERSYLSATVHLADGSELRVINAHFQHRKENTPTRLVHTEVLLERWDGAAHTIIAGDFNFWPSWEEPQRFAAAGFRSAQDEVGDPAAFTVPGDDPDNRVDWIFGTPDLLFSDFQILAGVTNSDHLPLVVTVEPRSAEASSRPQ